MYVYMTRLICLICTKQCTIIWHLLSVMETDNTFGAKYILAGRLICGYIYISYSSLLLSKFCMENISLGMQNCLNLTLTHRLTLMKKDWAVLWYHGLKQQKVHSMFGVCSLFLETVLIKSLKTTGLVVRYRRWCRPTFIYTVSSSLELGRVWDTRTQTVMP